MTGFLDIYTLIFLVLAVVVFFRLRSVLGRRTGHERPPFDPYTAGRQDKAAKTKTDDKVVELPVRNNREPAEQADRWKGFAQPNAPLAATFNAMAAIDRDFNPGHFTEGARAAYELVVMAFAKGDKAVLQPLLAREVYEGFADAIDARAKKGERVDSTFIGIDRAEIVDGAVNGSVAQLTVRFVSKLITATFSKSGELLDGDPKAVREVIDVWTFSRDLSSRDPNWKLIATEAA